MSLLAAAGAAGLANGLVNFGSSMLMRQIEQKDFEKNNEQLFQYQQKSQRNAAVNTRAGMLAAGISPAVMAEGNFAPMSAPSAPLQNKEAPKLDLLAAYSAQSQIALNKSTAELQSAQADKLQQETKSLEMKNVEARDSYVMTQTGLRDQLEIAMKHASSDEERNHLQVLADTMVEFPKANIDTVKQVLGLRQDISSITPRVLANKVDELTQSSILEDQIYKDNAHLPREQREKLIKDINYLTALTLKVRSETMPNSANLEKLTAETEKLKQFVKESNAKLPTFDAMVKKDNAIADSMNAKNDKKLIENGQWYWATYNFIQIFIKSLLSFHP